MNRAHSAAATLAAACLTALLLLQALPITADPARTRPRGPGAPIPQLVPRGESPLPPQAAPDLPGPEWSRLAYASFRDHNWDLYIAGPDHSGERRLTTHPAQDLYPRLNRGASQLLFSSNRAGNWDLYLMNADGTNQRPLTDDPADDYAGTWSPDGRHIAFQAGRHGQMDVFVMDASGANLQRLTTDPAYDGEPAWSPDGSQIAFISKRQGDYHLWLMAADGSDQRLLADLPLSAAPAWSPGGDLIAFDADGDGDAWQELYVVGIDGCCLQMLFDGSGGAVSGVEAYTGSWSPDGKAVAFTRAAWQKQQGSWSWTEARPYWADRAGQSGPLAGDWPDAWQPHWQTTDTQPPFSYIYPLPAYARKDVLVRWAAADVGPAGLGELKVQARIGPNGSWLDWQTGMEPADWQAVFFKRAGQSVYFRSRAVDRALNAEPYPAGDGQRWVTFYDWSIQGHVGDNRGAALEGAGLQPAPELFENHPADPQGHYRAYLAGVGSEAKVTWSGSGQGQLPLTAFDTAADAAFDAYLPPADDVVANGGFESGALDGWTAAGDFSPTVIATAAHTGEYGLQLAAPGTAAGGGEVSATQLLTVPLTATHPTLSLMVALDGGGSDSGTANGSAFELRLDDGLTETLLLTATTPISWTHQWADLADWAGQTVSLTVAVRQAAGQPLLAARVDEVSLGSAYPDLWLELDGPPAAGGGRLFGLVVAYGNRSGVPAPGAQVTLTLPVGMVFVRAAPLPDNEEPMPTWALGDLAPGESGQILVTALMTAPFQADTQYVALADIGASGPEPYLGNNTASATVWVGYCHYLPRIAR